ncbi:hypothetical protein B0H10DRAFT_2066286 [Mycena sp. CBHHK59/15]|nr:hypothetical protein B0H10DRAFT_2066286 [Mycena sp. CBHHK59/15]
MHSFVMIPTYAYTCLALVQAAAAYGPLCQFNAEAHFRLQHCKLCTPGTPQDTDIYYNHVGRCTLAILICYCCCMF